MFVTASDSPEAAAAEIKRFSAQQKFSKVVTFKFLGV
jgi:hypothetical protein